MSIIIDNVVLFRLSSSKDLFTNITAIDYGIDFPTKL